jgi:hypothetical protein
VNDQKYLTASGWEYIDIYGMNGDKRATHKYQQNYSNDDGVIITCDNKFITWTGEWKVIANTNDYECDRGYIWTKKSRSMHIYHNKWIVVNADWYNVDCNIFQKQSGLFTRLWKDDEYIGKIVSKYLPKKCDIVRNLGKFILFGNNDNFNITHKYSMLHTAKPDAMCSNIIAINDQFMRFLMY